jgi:hypothetical protein
LTAHEHRTAAGLFALLVFAYLWPVLVGGGALVATAHGWALAPWQHMQPGDVNQYTNLALDDVLASLYPWDVLARQMIHEGTFPAWNPHAFGGTPLWGNPEVAWLSPFKLPLWILPLNYGLGVAAALKLWTAGFGTYLLVRELRLGFAAGMLAGVSFALCAFNVVWLSHGVQVSVAVLFPWMLWLAERIVRRGRSVDGLALAGITLFLMTGGHPGTQLHVLLATVLYALVRVVALRGELERRDGLVRLGTLGGAIALGAAGAAVVLLPAQQAALDTAGAFARRNGSVEFHGSLLGPRMLRTALFPDWWGRPSEQLTGGPSRYNERTLYAGTLALVLAGVGVAMRGGWRAKAPFAAVAVVGLLVPARMLGAASLVQEIPVLNGVQNQRILLWFLLAVAVLAAYGLQAIVDGVAGARTWGIALGVAALAGVVGAASSGGGLGDALGYAFERSSSAADGVLALASALWWLALVGVLAVLLVVAHRRPEWRRVALGVVVLVAALDMLHFAHGYQPMAPASKAVPPSTPAVAWLQEHAGDEWRIGGTEYTLLNDWTTIYGLRDVRGYDQPQPSLRFFRLWRTIEPETTPGSGFTFTGLARPTMRVVGMLGGRYVIADPGTDVRSPVLSKVYDGEDATIFENELAVPRAYVAQRVRVVGGESEEISVAADPSMDARSDVVVRRDEVGAEPFPSGADSGAARVISEDNTRVTLRAEASRRSVVVLDDGWAPGWSVEVDGKPARALQANVVLRGVVVPAGEHEIVWRYRVPGLRAGVVLSVLALLCAAGWGAVLLLRARGRRITG